VGNILSRVPNLKYLSMDRVVEGHLEMLFGGSNAGGVLAAQLQTLRLGSSVYTPEEGLADEAVLTLVQSRVQSGAGEPFNLLGERMTTEPLKTLDVWAPHGFCALSPSTTTAIESLVTSCDLEFQVVAIVSYEWYRTVRCADAIPNGRIPLVCVRNPSSGPAA
jgi:hypothetical protein